MTEFKFLVPHSTSSLLCLSLWCTEMNQSVISQDIFSTVVFFKRKHIAITYICRTSSEVSHLFIFFNIKLLKEAINQILFYKD